MPVVSETLIGPGGEAVEGAQVEIWLYGNGSAIDGYVDGTIVGPTRLVTDAAGVYSATLPANADIVPSGTVYLVKVRLPRHLHGYIWETNRFIEVPDGAGPYTVAELLTDPPTALPSSPLSPRLYVQATEPVAWT